MNYSFRIYLIKFNQYNLHELASISHCLKNLAIIILELVIKLFEARRNILAPSAMVISPYLENILVEFNLNFYTPHNLINTKFISKKTFILKINILSSFCIFNRFHLSPKIKDGS